MRSHKKILVALAAAGIVASSGSAFTTSNSMPAGGTSGYGQVTSTGATITTVTTNVLITDASKLDKVVFASSTDVTGKTAQMTLKSGSTVVGSPYTCTLGTYAAGSMNITCTAADTPLLNSYDTTGLTVI